MAFWLVVLAFAVLVSTYSEAASKAHKALSRAYLKAYLKFEDDVMTQLDPLSDVKNITVVLRLRLSKWQAENGDSFRQYHEAMYNVTEFEDIYDSYIDHNGDLLVSLLNQLEYGEAAQYFKTNPFIFRFFFFAQGGDFMLQQFKTVAIGDKYVSYNFTQMQYGYIETNNNNSTELATKHYTFVGSAYNDSHVEDLKSHSTIMFTDPLYRKVYAETLDQTQAAVLDFRMNLIKYNYASQLVGQSDVDEVADIFPSMRNIQSTTRIYNPLFNWCIGIQEGEIEARAYNCDDAGKNLDWHLVEVAKGDFVFKNIRDGSCLVSAGGGVWAVPCNEDSATNLWNIDERRMAIESKRHGGEFISLTAADGSLNLSSLRAKSSSFHELQIWTVSTPYFNSDVLTAKYYRKSSPKEFIRNWPKILKAYMFKQSHNMGSAKQEIKDFFNGVKGLPYFDNLPKAIRLICNAMSPDKTILQAFGDKPWSWGYKEMRKSLALNPKTIDQSSTEFELFGNRTTNQTKSPNTKTGSIGDILGKIGGKGPSEGRDTANGRIGDKGISGSENGGSDDGSDDGAGDSSCEKIGDLSCDLYYENSTSDDSWTKFAEKLIEIPIIFNSQFDTSLGRLEMASFTNALNDMYLRAGLNMLTIINADTKDVLSTHGMNKRTIRRAYRTTNKALDLLVKDTTSISKGLSSFDVAARLARGSGTTSGKVLKILGEVVGLSRFGGDRVEMMPMTPLFNNSAVVAAFNDVDEWLHVTSKYNVNVIPQVTVYNITLM